MSGPEDEELAATWDLVIAGVAATQRRVLARIEQGGLPGPWFEVLRQLLGADGYRLPMSTLARHLGMTAGGFTKLADRMAREGLIDRRNSSGDRRVVYAALTVKGRELARKSATEYQAGLREHVREILPARHLAALGEASRELYDAHAASPEQSPGQVEQHLLTERDPALPDRRRGAGPSR